MTRFILFLHNCAIVKKIVFIIAFLVPTLAFSEGIKISGISGNVEVRLTPTAEWQSATLGAEVPQGSSIRTSEKSRASLLFPNKSIIWLKENTSMEIEKQVAQENQIALNVGSLKVRVPHLKRKEKFYLRTGRSVAAVRGTVFTSEWDGNKPTGYQVVFGEIKLGDVGNLLQRAASVMENKDDVKLTTVKELDEKTGEIKEVAYGLKVTLTQGHSYSDGKISVMTREQEIHALENWDPGVPEDKRQDQLKENENKRTELRQFAASARDINQDVRGQVETTREADFASGRTLKDRHGNLVQVEQRLDRPDSKTMQVLNVVKRTEYSSRGLRTYAYNGGNAARVDVVIGKVEFNKELPQQINEIPGFLQENKDTIKVEKAQLIVANQTDVDSVFAIGYLGKRDPVVNGNDDIKSDLFVGTLGTGGGKTGREKLFTLELDNSNNVSGLTRFVQDTTIDYIRTDGAGGELYRSEARRWQQYADSTQKLWLASENFVIDNGGKIRNISDFTGGSNSFDIFFKDTATQVVVFAKEDSSNKPGSVDATNFSGGNSAKRNVDVVVTPDIAVSILKTLATSADVLKTTQ